jgi:hypothetical protein
MPGKWWPRLFVAPLGKGVASRREFGHRLQLQFLWLQLST